MVSSLPLLRKKSGRGMARFPRHIQSTKRKVLGYFLIFNVMVLTRGNHQLSIINYQLMKT